MRAICATCDKYRHLIPGFCIQWRKYWNIPVDILGFSRPDMPDDDAFAFHQLEPVETRSWTANLRDWISKHAGPRFVFVLDDYWLTEGVDREGIDLMEREVVKGAVKGDLSGNTVYFQHRSLPNGLVEATQHAQYRTSTQPAIWRKEFMLSLLQGDRNPWEFELQNNAAVRQGRIVGPREELVTFANIYYKGAVAPYMLDKITGTDMKELREAGAFRGWWNVDA